jgi:RluA family pseudouridine synthase
MVKVIKLSASQAGQFWELPVIFEDAELLALDKPAGLAVTLLPTQPVDDPSLMKLLHAAIAEKKSWTTQNGIEYLQAVHRLDAEASGLLLLAKTKTTFTALANVAGAGLLDRTYLALVQGSASFDNWQVDLPLSPRPASAGFFRIDDRRGKKSSTKFEVVDRFSRWTLLRCRPAYDRPHQVRAHLARERLPLAADPLYRGGLIYLSRLKRNYTLKEGAVEQPLIARPALHSESLRAIHPVTGQPLELTCSLPKDFAVTVKYLKRYAA